MSLSKGARDSSWVRGRSRGPTQASTRAPGKCSEDTPLPTKSIAVPPNPSARRGRRIAPADLRSPEAEQVGVVVPPRRPQPPPRAVLAHPSHRYRVGERLRMGGGGYSVSRAAAFCKVLVLLPYEGQGMLLYRVRSETEAFERVVAEADLSRGG
jgi:hypothetical protein